MADKKTDGQDTPETQSSDEAGDQPAEAEAETEPEASTPQGDAARVAAGEPAEVSRHDEDHNYHYAGAEISERSGFVPLWMVLTVLFFILFGVFYAITHWDAGSVEPPSAQAQKQVGQLDAPVAHDPQWVQAAKQYGTVANLFIATLVIAIALTFYQLFRRKVVNRRAADW